MSPCASLSLSQSSGDDGATSLSDGMLNRVASCRGASPRMAQHASAREVEKTAVGAYIADIEGVLVCGHVVVGRER